jgi:RNA polymerase sigma factor (sigma-70 family)
MDIEALYNSHHTYLRNWLRSKCRDWDVADDLAATVFLKALAATSRGHGCREPGKETAWLWAITHNVWRDYMTAQRAGKRTAALVAWEEADECVGQDDAAQQHASDLWEIERAIAQHLTIEQQEGLLLPLQGWKLAEVAEMHGKSEGAVKAQLYRSRVKLRETTILRFQE